MQNDSIILFFKFSEYQWIKKLSEGNISFSCAGKFIHQATHTSNEIQGDRFEGVFARLLPNDPRIKQMQIELKNDLEILKDDQSFVLLRRKSSKFKPIFCLYGYKAQDVLDDCINPTLGLNSIKHTFDTQMYTGFATSLQTKNVISSDHRFAQLTFSKTETFLKKVRRALETEKLKYKIDNVNYTEFNNETFFITPTEDYNELFYKFPKYSHQYETRICIQNVSFIDIFRRYNLQVGPFSKEEFEITYTPLYFVTDAILQKK